MDVSKPAPNPPELPVTIGWRERVGFPEWGIKRVLAKSDTGAAHSAIDVGHLTFVGPDRVAFDVVICRETGETQHVEADVVRRSVIKSSLGDKHDRLFVRTQVKIGRIKKTVELGLVQRPDMTCRMLIGRSTLSPEFVVDSSRRYVVSGKKPKKPAEDATGQTADAGPSTDAPASTPATKRKPAGGG